MRWGGRGVGRSGELVLAISLVYGGLTSRVARDMVMDWTQV